MTDIKINLSRLKGKIVAIDGPAGAGKSTTARMVAERLGFVYLDTGAMYRALTLYALRHDIAPSDGDRLATIADKVPIEFRLIDGVNRVFFNDEDVTDPIRLPEVTKAVSEVSAHAGVRRAMVAKQIEFGRQGSIVAEGRDTTTVVFPNADLKVYLDASVEERARRRLLDMTHMGVSTSLEELEADIRRRDEYDSNREHSPLTRARDAVLIDTSNLTVEEQVERIVSLALARLKQP